MANVIRTVGRVFDISTKNDEGSATYIIGDASDGIVGTFSVQIHNLGGMSATITPVGRSRIPQARTGADDIPFLPIPYLPLFSAGAPGDMTYKNGPITAEAIVLIPATGLEIALDVAFAGGHGRIYWTPTEGCAA